MKVICQARGSVNIVELRPIVIRRELDIGTKKMEYQGHDRSTQSSAGKEFYR